LRKAQVIIITIGVSRVKRADPFALCGDHSFPAFTSIIKLFRNIIIIPGNLIHAADYLATDYLARLTTISSHAADSADITPNMGGSSSLPLS
jgi:hypothetical protein